MHGARNQRRPGGERPVPADQAQGDIFATVRNASAGTSFKAPTSKALEDLNNGWGRYVDEYEMRDGRWVFTHRKVTMDGYVPGGMGAQSVGE